MEKPKFLAFVKNEETLKLCQLFVTSKKFPENSITEGTIDNAIEKFSSGNRTPEFLVVELASDDHQKAFQSLDKLANYCEPDTKVIVIGNIDALSFYKELIGMGIAEYLLNPIKLNQLEKLLSQNLNEEKKDVTKTEGKTNCRVISVTGTRGGVGTSTIALNLAKLLSKSGAKTLLIDFDHEFGVIPLLLDIEPNRGLVDALEKPERVDSLFLERVMTKLDDNFFVIGAEKSLADNIKISEKAAQTLFEHFKSKFEFVVIDMKRIDHSNHYILQHSENIVVTELSIPALRDSMRIHDLIKDTLGNKQIKVIVNKSAINKKFETPQKDFEKGIGQKVDYVIPFEPEIYGFNNNGQVIVEAIKDSKFSRTINDIAQTFIKGKSDSKTPVKKMDLLGKFKPKK